MTDELVKAALLKWPNVPDCFDWLMLDARGKWRIGEERLLISNAPMNAFISRNYTSDAQGRWFFQNGPQKVFVEIECTPWIWRIFPDESGPLLRTQAGEDAAAPNCAWIDEVGRFYFEADRRRGVLHDHDGALALEMLAVRGGKKIVEADLERVVAAALAGDTEHLCMLWPGSQIAVPLNAIRSDALEEVFGFVAHPALSAE